MKKKLKGLKASQHAALQVALEVVHTYEGEVAPWAKWMDAAFDSDEFNCQVQSFIAGFAEGEFPLRSTIERAILFGITAGYEAGVGVSIELEGVEALTRAKTLVPQLTVVDKTKVH